MAIRRYSSAPALVALIVALGIACAPAAAPPAPAAPASNAASAPAAATSAPAAPVAATPAGQQPPATAVRYGDLLLLADAGIYIALDEGYFAEQALSLDLVTFDSASNMVAPLATNQLDVGGGAPSAGLFNALRGGVNVRIVADKGHSDATPPGFAVSQFIVRKALIDRGQVKSAADLKGLRYGRVAPGISPELDLIAWLKEGGLQPGDLDLTPMSFPDMIAGFANDSIDAAGPVEPFAATIVDQGTGVVMKRDYEVNPNHQVAVLLYSPEFSASPLATKFMMAYLRGVRLYNDAFLKNNAGARERAINAMVQHTPVKNRALYDQMVLPGLHPDGKMNLQSFAEQQDWFLASGSQQGRVDLQSFIDLQHAEAAARQLGPYQ